MAVARVKMAGVADAAASATPGGGDGGRRGVPEHSLLQPDGGQRRSSFAGGGSESRGPSPSRSATSASSPPSPCPSGQQHQHRTETLGFYESDRQQQQKRGGPSGEPHAEGPS